MNNNTKSRFIANGKRSYGESNPRTKRNQLNGGKVAAFRGKYAPHKIAEKIASNMAYDAAIAQNLV